MTSPSSKVLTKRPRKQEPRPQGLAVVPPDLPAPTPPPKVLQSPVLGPQPQEPPGLTISASGQVVRYALTLGFALLVVVGVLVRLKLV
jgi:hypothetical protein